MTTFRFTKANKLKVLRRMRELLARPRGWIKGELSRDGGHCLLGAEYRALGELTERWSFVYGPYWDNQDRSGEKLSIHSAVGARGFITVEEFNDHPKTRKKDVLALIDERIAELEL